MWRFVRGSCKEEEEWDDACMGVIVMMIMMKEQTEEIFPFCK